MAQPDDGRPAEPDPPTKRRWLFASRADVALFLRTLVRRFLDDLCLERAAALSYTGVLSLVPAAAVSLAFLSALPQSDALRSDVEDLLTRHLLPTTGETAVGAFRTFLGKAAGLSALGFLGLAVTTMVLLITVNSAFDTIWRVTRPRPLVIRLLAYWAILTMGPMLMGIALSISGVLLATGERYAGEAFTWSIGWITPIVPFLLQAAAFTMSCRIAPWHRATRWRVAPSRRCCSRAPSVASRSISSGFRPTMRSTARSRRSRCSWHGSTCAGLRPSSAPSWRRPCRSGDRGRAAEPMRRASSRSFRAAPPSLYGRARGMATRRGHEGTARGGRRHPARGTK